MTDVIDAPPLNSAETVASTDVPQLTEAYHKAHKQYALFAAILLGWVLIGIVPAVKPFENINVTLRNPEVAPTILVVLIVYFGFRLTIEWFQNDVRRRQSAASIVDFASSHCIGGAAIAVY